MKPLEAARHLQKRIGRLRHFPEEVTQGPYSPTPGAPMQMCRHYCSSWPCDAAKVTDAADSLPAIIAALEAVEAYISELEGQGERIDVLKRVQAYERMVAAFYSVETETT